MKKISLAKWLTASLGLLLLAAFTFGVVYAQDGGSITVNACYDQNADGDCDDPEDGPAPADVEACLNDTTMCQTVPASFTNLAVGSYTPFLRFVGASQGHYPTTPRTPLDLGDGEQAEVTLGAVYPLHPKGVAVHEQLNRVYVAFQGPVIEGEVTAAQIPMTKPYPFVAVIDGETDEVLQTIPGGPDGIGRDPWGVAVSGDYVYVGSFREGRISVIDPFSNTVVTNIEPARDNFQPTSPAVNPVTSKVHFPDIGDGRLVIIDGTTLEAEPRIADQFGNGPFEVAIADVLQGYNYVTMRSAVNPNPFQFRKLDSVAPYLFEPQNIIFNGVDGPQTTGIPHAIGLWQDAGMDEPRIFITYAQDPRNDGSPPDFDNPNELLVYSFPTVDPKNVTLRNVGVGVGDYAEVGLVYNQAGGHMLGTYAGFPYVDAEGDVAACDSPERGGTYALDFDGNVLAGETAASWQLPDVVVGNPPLVSDGLDWKNPFEIAINPNNGKVYVTDRCWNDFPEGGQPGGGAVLIFNDTGTEPEPTPTPTTEPEPDQIVLAFDGPTAVDVSDTFSVTVVARNVPEPGLYGVQFEVNYDPALISAGNLQLNPAFEFVVVQNTDNVSGTITLVASRQGDVPGLTGDVNLLTFNATAIMSGTVTFTFADEKIGDSAANAFDIVTESHVVTIGEVPTPTPTPETPTPTPETPTPTPETPTPTPETPTPTPETPTPTPETPTPTPEPELAVVSGQVILAGRAGNDWSDAVVMVDDSSVLSDTTDAAGEFSIVDVPVGAHASITADAAGYLPALCISPTVTISETVLNSVTLLSGNIIDEPPDPPIIDIADATAVGASFGATGPDLAADINRDLIVDIFDVILVSVNYGQVGPQAWDCLSP